MRSMSINIDDRPMTTKNFRPLISRRLLVEYQQNSMINRLITHWLLIHCLLISISVVTQRTSGFVKSSITPAIPLLIFRLLSVKTIQPSSRIIDSFTLHLLFSLEKFQFSPALNKTFAFFSYLFFQLHFELSLLFLPRPAHMRGVAAVATVVVITVQRHNHDDHCSRFQSLW